MIVRVVKLTIDPERVNDFQQMFEKKKEKIRNFPGCKRLELLRDRTENNIFFTYSFWNLETDLENYRKSEMFAETWEYTKSLFSGKPEAWSLDQKAVLM